MGEADDVNVCSEDYHLALYSLCDLFSSNHVAYRCFILPLPTLNQNGESRIEKLRPKRFFFAKRFTSFGPTDTTILCQSWFWTNNPRNPSDFPKVATTVFSQKVYFLPKVAKNPNSAVVASGGGGLLSGGLTVPQGHR